MIALMRKESITFTLASPAHLRAMMRAAKGDAPMLPDLRIVVSSATLSPMERRMMRRWITPRLYFAYGTNEVGYVSVASPEDQDRNPDTVGRIIDGVRVSIVDLDGKEVPAGMVGEIRIRAPETPSRYEGDPDTTGKYYREGWFHPGDLGLFDAEGYLVLKGRTDDVINSAGLKFYPSEIEEILLAYPGVTEVAVLPWPEPRAGEAPVAVIVPGAGYDGEEILGFCQKRMPAYRIPIHFLTMPSLPKNAMGKVQKAVLKTLVARTLPVVPSRPKEDAPR
jgi:acyl-coenzyme A synthetase/AMP-(fatty) acid ligase